MTVVVGVLFLLRVTWVSRVVVVGFALSSVPVLLLARAANLRLLHALRRSRFDPYRVLLMGQPDRAGPYLDALQRHPEWGMQVIGALAEPSEDTAARVEMLGPPNQLGALLVQQPVDEVYVVPGGLDPDALADVAQTCDEMGVRLSLDANFLGLRTAEPELSDFDGWSVLSFGPLQGAGPELVLKRTCDVVGSLLGLLFLWPLLLGVAICIKLEDRGSVFYVQQRAGRYGRLFSMVKFRSMRENADQEREALQSHNEMSGPAFKIADDPRITRVGKWIRRLSIDELPQLFNVVQGHMSLVGPRPPLPEEVAQYERWQLRRLSMRPGLTCIWQVSGRNEIDFERWMELDLQYIDNWSLWLDFRLIMRTVPAVLRGTGAR